MLGKRTDPSQQAFADLLRGLFHWKLDTSDNRAYSLDPKDYPRLPLFSLHKEQTCYLNQVFWLVYDDYTSWRSLSFYHRPKVEDIEAHAESKFAAIPEASLPACPKISKLFIAYPWRALWLCPRTNAPAALSILVPQGSPRRFQPPRS
jgi:hypothetical protein